MATRRQWIRDYLRQWAKWYVSSSGFSASTREWRMHMGSLELVGQHDDSRRLPNGVVPPRSLLRLIKAMREVSEASDDGRRAIACVRTYYCLGEAACCEVLETSARSVRRLKKAGEDRLKEVL